jgi:hypothetical protein
MSAHTYWRVNVSANNSGVYLTISELRFLDAGNNNNMGLKVAALYSAQLNAGGDNSAEAAFDSNNATKWACSGAVGYLGVQFSSAIEVTHVTIVGTLSGEASYAPRDFAVQFSDDGIVWETALAITSQTSWGINETRSFSCISWGFSGNISESLSITNWRISAHSVASGAFVGSTLSGESVTAYSIRYYGDSQLCNLTLSPKVDYAWSAAKSASLGDYVVAANPDATPHIWKCTTAGTTHATTEPTWNLSGTTTDNTVTWTYIAPLVNPISLGCKIPV